MVGQQIYGASSNFYSGTSYGRAVENEKCKQVRKFTVTGETARSWVLDHCYKVGKKSMEFNTGSFVIEFFKTYPEALASLSR